MTSTLELMIEKVLHENHCILNPEVTNMEDVIDYIEQVNSERTVDDGVYTPEEWFNDTRESYPEYLMDLVEDENYLKDAYFDEVIFVLLEFKEDYLTDTGEYPNISMFSAFVKTKEFKDKMRRRISYSDNVKMDLGEVFCRLMDYWNIC